LFLLVVRVKTIARLSQTLAGRADTRPENRLL